MWPRKRKVGHHIGRSIFGQRDYKEVIYQSEFYFYLGERRKASDDMGTMCL